MTQSAPGSPPEQAGEVAHAQLATPGVFDDAVSNAVESVAALLDELREKRPILGGHDRILDAAGVDRLQISNESHRDSVPVERRGPGDDAVEIAGIQLRLHHRLTAAPRAAEEIGISRAPSVVRPNETLGGLRGRVHRPVAEVELSLQVVVGPARVDPASPVPGVGADGGVASGEG